MSESHKKKQNRGRLHGRRWFRRYDGGMNEKRDDDKKRVSKLRLSPALYAYATLKVQLLSTSDVRCKG